MTEEKKMARLFTQQSYTTDDWLEWLHKVCEGRLAREESIKEKCPEQYEMIMNLFYDWSYVVDAFHERFKLAAKPLAVAKSQGTKPSAAAPVVADSQGSRPSVAASAATGQRKVKPLAIASATVEPRGAESGAVVTLPLVSGPQEAVRDRRGKRRSWTKEECISFLRRLYDQLGKMPTQSEVYAWSVEWDGPSYATLLKCLGKKESWQELLDKTNPDEAKKEAQNGVEPQSGDVSQSVTEAQSESTVQSKVELQNENEPQSESGAIPVISVVFHSMELDFTLNGKEMRAHVDFGPATKE